MRRAGTGARGRGRRRCRRSGPRRPAGRWPRGGRGSGASARSRGGRAGARARAGARTSSNSVTASRAWPCRARCRVASCRSRPIAASMRPRRRASAGRGRARGTPLGDLAAAEQPLEPPVDLVRARDHEQPDVSRSSRCTIPGRSGSSPPAIACASRPWTSVPPRVARRRVHDDPCRLVDDEQVLVLPGDAQRNLLGLERRLAPLGQRRSATSSPPSSRWLFGRGSPSTVTPPSASSRSAAAREPTSSSAGEEAVEPLSGRLGRHRRP